jgi:hypothetical protein
VPAVLVSGASSADELARIEASGILLLHKPVPPARLRSVLAHLLGAGGPNGEVLAKPRASGDERRVVEQGGA